METIENNTTENPELNTPQQKGGAKAASAFWARFPTPEARSQHMKERWAKIKAKRARKAAAQAHRQENPETHPDEDQAADKIFEMRILLADVLDMLDAVNVTGIGGCPNKIMGRQVNRRCLMAAISIISRGINRLNVWEAE